MSRPVRAGSPGPLVLVSLLVGGLFSCGSEEEAAPEALDTRKYATGFSAPSGLPEPPALTFSDVTAASGVAFEHVTGAFGRKYIPETMGSGVAFLDYDGDGLDDLFFVQSREFPGHETGPPATMALFRNLGGLTFQDVSAETGVAISAYGMGATVGDYDADGDPDVFITCLGSNILLRNDGGSFVDATEAAGLAGATWSDGSEEHGSWSTGAAWFDADVDGDLDLFVCNYIRWSMATDIEATLTGDTKAYARPHDYPGDSCRLYRNDGGTFTDVSEEKKVFNASAKALGVSLADFNQDGRPDIVVANDTQPNCLFMSQPDGSYDDCGEDACIAYDQNGVARAGMGVDVADFRNQGKLAIAIGNFHNEPVSLFAEERPGVFLASEQQAGLARGTLQTLTFGLLFLDYDLDGRLDLLACNGHIEPDINEIASKVTYAQAPQLFWNQGEGRFVAVTEGGAALRQELVGRGLAVGDLDGDGDLDLVITTSGGGPRILRNDSPLTNHWVRFDLKSAQPGNPTAYGARVILEAGGQTQQRLARTGSSYLSQGEDTLTFGLGAATKVDSVTVHWPSGSTDTFAVPEYDREWTLVEGADAVQSSGG